MSCDETRLLAMITNARELATGGQKHVFAGHHAEYGAVVLKIIRPGTHAIDVERTRREVRAVERLRSSSVPRIYEHNADDDSATCLYLIEEYVDAPTLREQLSAGRTFSTSEIVRFLESMLDIIRHAEQVGIVHRDIKPENILVPEANDFRLLDFGIARHLDLDSITPTNAPFGLFTVGYAASEQARNLKRAIDSRADLFSIAVVATEMYTGTNPYVAGADDVFAVLRRIDTVSVPWIRFPGDTKSQLATFVRILGDHRRNRRPRSAEIALSLLDAVKATLDNIDGA